MFSKDRWNEILEALNANKVRTFLTAFGVAWGIFILVALLALTNGLKNGVISDFGDFATNSMFMWTQGTSKPYKGLPKGRFFSYKIDDVAAIKSEIPNLKYVSPRNQLGGFSGAFFQLIGLCEQNAHRHLSLNRPVQHHGVELFHGLADVHK